MINLRKLEKIHHTKQSKNNSLVSIIILNYNAGNLLIDCIDSILKSSYHNYEIILVDNASHDNSHIECKKKFPQIRLIENNDNLGYCEGNNVGICSAKGDFLVILNPDTIVDHNWLNELILAYDKYGDGLYQPKFLTTTNHNTLMSSGNMIQLFGFGYARGKGELDEHNYSEHELIGYATGACLFTSTKIMKQIGMFDPFLFAYHDDLDLGWRAALQGIPSHFISKSIVYHPHEGFSFKWTPFKYFLLERNRLYCLLTHYSRKTIYKLLPFLILVELSVFIFYCKKGMASSKIKASFDIIKNRKKINICYKKIQNTRIVNDKQLIKNFQDGISIPKEMANTGSNEIFNNFLKDLSKLARKFI